MLGTALNIVKWMCLPALLVASLFAPLAGKYAAWINLAAWVAAILLTHGAIRRGNYYWASAFLAATLVFSPLFMADKVFLLLVLACITTVVIFVVACRTQPQPLLAR